MEEEESYDFGNQVENLEAQLEIEEEESDEVVLFIEYKYCTLCHIEQPLRCKHCKQCDQCVATHDHHCPWIGNCVGERNRLWFLIFLILQFSQLMIGMSICCEMIIVKSTDIETLSDSEQIYVFFLFLVVTLFTLFVTPLVFFHTYLSMVNMTSWEYLSWMRITYLKVWPKKYGSPFS